MSIKRALPLLFAFASRAIAICDGTFTITSNNDVSQISDCGTYNGDIVIDATASGSIAITGISHLRGDLTCNNATGLTGLSFHQLVTISGGFSLEGLTRLADLNFDSIMEVGDIGFYDLPALQVLDFATGIETADRVTISNTGLRDLSGIELVACNSLDISRNSNLITINLNGITNTTGEINIVANGAGLDVSLGGLTSSSGINVQNADTLNFTVLDTVTGTLELSYNNFRSFAAPDLTLVLDMDITNNPLLSNLSFPLLPEITGGLSITNNSRLTAISGFPDLTTISGNLNLTGRFSHIDLPALVDVQGTTNVDTSINNSTICTFVNNSNIFKGLQTCVTGTESPTSLPDDNQGTSTSNSTGTGGSDTTSGGTSGTNGNSSGNSISGGAIGGIVAGVVVVLILLCCGWWWFKRRRAPKPERLPEQTDTTPELSSGGHHEKPELAGSDNYGDQKPPGELKSDYKERVELPMDNYVSELEGNNVYEMDANPKR